MDDKNKIIIAALIGIIIVLGGAIAGTLLKEPSKTVELFENGTTIEVSASTNLTAHDEFSTTFVTGKNTTIIGVDNNNLAGALASKILSSALVDKGERQDNGLYKLDKNSIMELGDQLGLGYDENDIKEVFVGIKHNNTVNQTIIIIGIDEQEMINIINSIHWKQGIQSNITDSSGYSGITYPLNQNSSYVSSSNNDNLNNSYDDDYNYDDEDYDDDYNYDDEDYDVSSSSGSDSGSVETTT